MTALAVRLPSSSRRRNSRVVGGFQTDGMGPAAVLVDQRTSVASHELSTAVLRLTSTATCEPDLASSKVADQDMLCSRLDTGDGGDLPVAGVVARARAGERQDSHHHTIVA